MPGDGDPEPSSNSVQKVNQGHDHLNSEIRGYSGMGLVAEAPNQGQSGAGICPPVPPTPGASLSPLKALKAPRNEVHHIAAQVCVWGGGEQGIWKGRPEEHYRHRLPS